VFMGLAITPENDKVYVAGGQTNKIFMFDLKTGKSLGFIDCSFKDQEVDYTDGYIGDLVLTKDGKFIYAVDQINFRMIIIDAINRKRIKSIPVGRYPFGICLSPDEKEAYVANAGMYKYKVIPGIDPDHYLETALKFPPFAYLSESI
jgi:YVTN family beta-propeller protein